LHAKSPTFRAAKLKGFTVYKMAFVSHRLGRLYLPTQNVCIPLCILAYTYKLTIRLCSQQQKKYCKSAYKPFWNMDCKPLAQHMSIVMLTYRRNIG